MRSSVYRTITLRTVAAHKVRLALTVLAVLLGTAFVAGSFTFTATLDQSFKSAVATAYDDVDAVVSAPVNEGGLTDDLRESISGREDVAKANLYHTFYVVLADDDGTTVGSGSGSEMGQWYSEEQSLQTDEKLVDGRAPDAQDEAIVNESAVESGQVSVGQHLIMVSQLGRYEVTITGTFSSPLDTGLDVMLRQSEESFLANFPSEALGATLLLSANGISADELVANLSADYPALDIATGEHVSEEVSQRVTDGLSFVNYFLLAFGLIALLMGTFLVSNTFAMTVAQRNKEFALLRSLGATQRAISRMVVGEAALIGLVGSILGVFAGMGLVVAIRTVLGAAGYALPGGVTVGWSWAGIVVPILLGVIVTIISAWAPAGRAGSVQPVEAMRSDESAAPKPLKGRTVLGAGICVVGIALMLGGALAGDAGTLQRVLLVGGGTVALVIGYFRVGPAVSLPVLGLLGRVFGAPFRAIGPLAATNARRNPRRSANTAFALTLGIMLVTTIAMFGSSMKATLNEIANSALRADFAVSGPLNQAFPMPAETEERVKEADGVDSVVSAYLAPLEVAGMAFITASPDSPSENLAADGNLADAAPLHVTEGDVDLTGREGVVLSTNVAESLGVGVGDELPVSSYGQVVGTVEVLGVYEGVSVGAPLVISATTAKALADPSSLWLYLMWVNGDDTLSHEELRASLEEAVNGLVVPQVLDGTDMAGVLAGIIDQMLAVVYGLLALAVVIAILGIVNTLTLGIIERRREIGMLRAVGMQRSQVRGMITLEAVQVAVFGAIAGVILGLGVGWCFLSVLSDAARLERISVPTVQILWMVLGSAVVGVLAALWPARKAAQTPPLAAIVD